MSVLFTEEVGGIFLIAFDEEGLPIIQTDCSQAVNMKIELLNEYPYLYETHMHTNLGSACGNNSGEEMARACKEFGYTGAFITDHNWGGNTSVSRELPWKEWMTKYSYGYLDAKKYGDANDFDVYFGMEFPFRQNFLCT